MDATDLVSVLIYMNNSFTQEESNRIFGSEGGEYSLGNHIWNKYMELKDTYRDYTLNFLLYLDAEALQKLVDRACYIFHGRHFTPEFRSTLY